MADDYFDTRLLHSDCLEKLRELPDASIDSIVTDPPYLISFMGKDWDSADGVAGRPDVWRECRRLLKPGGHLLAFGGTRTYHRMAAAIEDAGFEIRDSIHWTYGSGFPKSLDVSKAIDKRGGATAGFQEFRDAVKDAMKRNGVSRTALTKALNNQMLSHYLTAGSQPAVPNARDYRIIRDTVGLGNAWDHLFLDEAEREVVGTKTSGIANKSEGPRHTIGASKAVVVDITAPATDAAAKWQGWGTALKPSHEPIVVARKPLDGTVAANVLAYGTGALNIDGTRVGNEERTYDLTMTSGNFEATGGGKNVKSGTATVSGRWPANTVLTHAAGCRQVGTVPDTFGGGAKASSGFVDGYENDGFQGVTVASPVWSCAPGCPVAALDRQSGPAGAAAPASGPTYSGPSKSNCMAGAFNGNGDKTPVFHADKGGASRFFTVTEWEPRWDDPFLYVPKPAKKERNAGLNGLKSKTIKFGNQRNGDDVGDGSVNDKFTTSPSQNHHPTVKPVALMRHLVRLVTPPGGVVLDPFLGSGTTAVAAILEGFDWVGCEMTDEYLPIIKGRVEHARKEAAKAAKQAELPLE